MDLLKVLWSKLWFRISIFVFFIIMLILIVVFSLIGGKSVADIKNTNLAKENISVFNNKIRAYNGVSFYEIDPISDTKPKILYTPNFRLPKPSKTVYSDNGVLLNFESGINFSPVEEYFEKNDISSFSSPLMTWYLDFSDGSFSLVNASDIKENLAVYSEKDNGYYFVANNNLDADETGSGDSVYFYDLKTKSSSVVTSDSKYIISSLSSCDKDSFNLCVVGQNLDESDGKLSLSAVSKDGSIKTIKKVDGQILNTPDKNVFLNLTDTSTDGEIDVVYKKIDIFDISNDKITSFSGEVPDSNLAISKLENNYYFVNGLDNNLAYLNTGISNSVDWRPLPINKDMSINNGFIVYNNLSTNDFILVQQPNGNYYIINNSPTDQQFNKTKEEQVTKVVNECVQVPDTETSVSRDGSLYSIYIDYNKLSESIVIINKCLAKNVDNLYGYTYEFRGIDTLNGRVATD